LSFSGSGSSIAGPSNSRTGWKASHLGDTYRNERHFHLSQDSLFPVRSIVPFQSGSPIAVHDSFRTVQNLLVLLLLLDICRYREPAFVGADIECRPVFDRSCAHRGNPAHSQSHSRGVGRAECQPLEGSGRGAECDAARHRLHSARYRVDIAATARSGRCTGSLRCLVFCRLPQH